jgi:hypothetical protein
LAAVDDKSVHATVARMTACDGMPFNTLVKSPDLRRLFLSQGVTSLPKSSNCIRGMEIDYADKIRSNIKQELKAKLKQGKRWSLTMDEWTSIRNRRYMVVRVSNWLATRLVSITLGS